MYLSYAIFPWRISPTHEAGQSGLWMKGWGHLGRNEVPPRRGWVQPFEWGAQTSAGSLKWSHCFLAGVWVSKLSRFAYLIWMPPRHFSSRGPVGTSMWMSDQESLVHFHILAILESLQEEQASGKHSYWKVLSTTNPKIILYSYLNVLLHLITLVSLQSKFIQL